MSIDSNVNNPSNLPPISGLPLDGEKTKTPASSVSPAVIVPKDSTETAPPHSNVKVSSDLTVNLPQPNSFDIESLDWGKFLMLIWSTTSAQQEQQYAQESPTVHQKGMHLYAAAEAAELAKIPMAINNYLMVLQQIKAQQNNFNDVIAIYNNKMKTLTDQMNQAIAAHNNGDISDEEFANAVNNYNAQKAQISQEYQNSISLYNQQINSLNEQIDNLNAMSNGWGIGSFGHFQLISDNLNLPDVNIGTTGPIAVTLLTQVLIIGSVPTQRELMTKLYDAKVDSFIESMKMVSQLENATDIVRDQHFAMLKLIFPGATVAQLLNLVGNMSIANVVVSMNSQAVQETLNKAIFQSLIKNASIRGTENVIAQLQSLALTEIAHASLFSVLGTLPTAGNGQAVAANVAINYIGYISQFIKGDTFNDAVHDIASENHLSPTETSALKAALGQTLWTIALSNLAQTTGMYGLPVQLLGQLPNSSFPSAPENAISLQAVFSHPAERKAFENELINLMLMNNRTSFEAAQIIAGNVVGALMALDQANPQQIQQELIKQFGLNFDAEFSHALSNLGLAFILNSRLDTELKSNPFYLSNVLLEGSRLLNSSYLKNFSLSSVNRNQFIYSLSDLLKDVSPNLSSSEAKSIAKSLWNELHDHSESLTSLNVLHHSLGQKISNRLGLPPDTSLELAAAVNLGIGNVGLAALLNPGKGETLSLDALTSSFRSEMTRFYLDHGVPETEAERLGDMATAAVMTNPHSSYNVMLSIEEEFKKAGIEKSNELWVEIYRKDSAISRELAVFIAATTVNPLLYSQLVSISGGSQGGKFNMPIQG